MIHWQEVVLIGVTTPLTHHDDFVSWYTFVIKANIFPFSWDWLSGRINGYLYWLIGSILIAIGYYRLVTTFFPHYWWTGLLFLSVGLGLFAVGAHFVWPRL